MTGAQQSAQQDRRDGEPEVSLQEASACEPVYCPADMAAGGSRAQWEEGVGGWTLGKPGWRRVGRG
jgi:hypothetical protein